MNETKHEEGPLADDIFKLVVQGTVLLNGIYSFLCAFGFMALC